MFFFHFSQAKTCSSLFQTQICQVVSQGNEQRTAHFLRFINNSEGRGVYISESLLATLEEPSFPQCLLNISRKRSVKKCQVAYLHRMRLGRSVEGTAGSCWGAVHHFLLSLLPPDKHQEGWQLSPAPHCCHQGVAVLQLGIRNKKPDYW